VTKMVLSKFELLSNFHSHHFAYINNLYDIELGHN